MPIRARVTALFIFFAIISCNKTRFQMGLSKGEPDQSADTGITEPLSNSVESPPAVSIEVNAADSELVAGSIEKKIELVLDSEPTKLVLVVDDSKSMNDKQELLSEGIRKGLMKLRNNDVEVFVYSTSLFGSQFIDGQANLRKITGIGIFGNHTGQYFNNKGQKTVGRYLNEYVRSGSSSTVNTKFSTLWRQTSFIKDGVEIPISTELTYDHDSILEQYFINKSGFAEGTVTLSPEMTNEQFQEAVNQIAEGVKLGDQGASFGELPLCTIAMALRNNGPFAPFNKDDRVSFLILTDEDQADLRCPIGFEAEEQAKELVAVWPEFEYTMISVDYTEFCDSGSNGKCNRTAYYNAVECNINPASNQPYDPNCIVEPQVDNLCNDAQKAAYTAMFKAQYSLAIEGGTVLAEPTGCRVVIRKPSRNFTPPGIDATKELKIQDPNCASDETKAQALDYYSNLYPNLKLTGECIIHPVATEQLSAEYLYLEGIIDGNSLSNFIQTRAEEIFGQGHYSFSAIANLGEENPEGCNASPENRSEKILDLVSEDKVLSICEPSYEKAFDWFAQFSNYSPQREFNLPEGVISINMVNRKKIDGTIVELDVDQWTFSDDTLVVQPKILLEGESLKIFFTN